LVLVGRSLAVCLGGGWWQFSDSSGLTKKREIDKMERRKVDRREKAMEALGMNSPARPRGWRWRIARELGQHAARVARRRLLPVGAAAGDLGVVTFSCSSSWCASMVIESPSWTSAIRPPS
jgi:hypothetical protein